jgi:hypothetical protein
LEGMRIALRQDWLDQHVGADQEGVVLCAERWIRRVGEEDGAPQR